MNPRDITLKDIDNNPETHFLTMAAPSSMGHVQDLQCLADDEAIVSFWKPTEGEINILILGGSVQLTIIGSGMPPVALGVTDA